MYYLISKAANNKFRVVYLNLLDWSDEAKGFVITRQTGQVGGKITQQPDIVVSVGKAKRTVTEQAHLQLNSELKKYLDKGYKEYPTDPKLSTEEELEEFYGAVKTDANGFAKHMLAKSADKVSESSINKVKYWYASRKIDGIRASLYWDGEKIKSASRGGGDYDCSLMQFIENEELNEFFKRHPDWTLDFECYKHGLSLQTLSGEARRCETLNGSDILEAYVYDVMIPDMKFEDRLKILNQIGEELHLGFDPEREWKEGELRMQLVPHVKVSGYDNIMKLHNEYVAEGWEGVVCRNPDKEYGFGKRTNDMLKFKMYKDDCFKVIGKQGGLREIEDMVFILETEDGKQFKAKPFGDLAQKTEYWNNFEEKYKGKIGECKYFYLSDEGTPLQPSFKAFRIDL
jgi:ATP-dependent DNA ligase